MNVGDIFRLTEHITDVGYELPPSEGGYYGIVTETHPDGAVTTLSYYKAGNFWHRVTWEWRARHLEKMEVIEHA